MFDDAYEVVLADTQESLSIHFRLRFQSYCMENRFEDPVDFPDQEESDRYDMHAVHFIVRHKATNEWVAAVRVILPDSHLFPAELHGEIHDHYKENLKQVELAEISRACRLRYRFGREYVHNPQENLITRFIGPVKDAEIFLGMLRAVFFYCLNEENIRYFLFFSQPSMARMLARYNIVFEQIGPPSEHRGVRQPYLVDLDRTRDKIDQIAMRRPGLIWLMKQESAYQRYSLCGRHEKYMTNTRKKSA